MFKITLTQYLKQRQSTPHPDIYYERYGRDHSIEVWVDKVMKGEAGIGHAFEWAAFRDFCRKTVSLAFEGRVHLFIAVWSQEGRARAFKLYPDLLVENLSLSEEEML